MSLQEEVRAIAERAKEASVALAGASGEQRNAALRAMAQALRDNASAIVEANEADVASARETGTKESLIDRLALDSDRIAAMADALDDVAALPDAVGRTLERRTLESGIELEKVSVPLGVVAVIYEARPNVTADAAGICLKSGNAAILRGGSMAGCSNEAVAGVLADAVASVGLPRACVSCVPFADRAATDELMGLRGLVDVLVPRGGAGLIQHCVEHAKVPVIETGTGNCHVYVHASADREKARAIIRNAKCRRYGVCNAAETLLVDESVAAELLPPVLRDMADEGVLLHCDPLSLAVAEQVGLAVTGERAQAVSATEADWATEYLGPELAVRCVGSADEAIAHVNRYGTKHSEAIVADAVSAAGAKAIDAFLTQVDAAAVYANASTAFTDGGQFGLGAEIGISTQKLHARGPFATEALTSYKYVLRGTGQVRP